MEFLKLKCPACNSSDFRVHMEYQTQTHGPRLLYECQECFTYFSQTKHTLMAGLKKPISLIWHVLNARTEGLGLNAAVRVFGVAKNTILEWERRCADLRQVLFVYALVHEFLQVVIEGDEGYTRIEENLPADQSLGWTILLMDRASRFIWSLDCGRRDKRLFKTAVRTLEAVINQTQDLTLMTDGERRYGNLLFEICHDLIRNGKPGRPRKTLKPGVAIRIKNKGAQAHKKGRKLPKYQSPWPEHPQTDSSIETQDIHANHTEAFFSALRRKCATFRRRTNTYAKSTAGLQRILNVYWVIHNFVRVHFTTQEVPAVALGVLERRLSVDEIFQVQVA